MADFTALTCPSCGGKLENTTDSSRLICGYCGNTHIINRKDTKDTSERTASELALERLHKELANLKNTRNTLVSQSKIDTSKDDPEVIALAKDVEKRSTEIETAKSEIESVFREIRNILIFFPILGLLLFGLVYSIMKYGDEPTPALFIFICAALPVGILISIIRFFITKKKQNKLKAPDSIKKQKVFQLDELKKKKILEYKESIQSKISDIDKQILAKQSEIDKHYKIVSNP